MVHVYLTGKVCDRDSYPLFLLAERYGYQNIVRHYDSNENDRLTHAKLQSSLGAVPKLQSLAIIDGKPVLLNMLKLKYDV